MDAMQPEGRTMPSRLGSPSAEQLSSPGHSCVSSPAGAHMRPLPAHVPKAVPRECLQPPSPVGGLGFPRPGKPGLETREEERGQERLWGRGAWGGTGGPRGEVGSVRVVKR